MQHTLQKLEFYITNLCNLTCSNCNRFNDHRFSGHQIWQDYADDYKEWGNKLKAEKLVILGGEPLLNPSICDWIRGITRCFGTNVQVLTNGTRLNRTPGLYDTLAEHPDGYNRGWIGISVHNTDDLDRYIKEVEAFLRGRISTFHGKNTLDHTGHPVSAGADYTWIDENQVTVRIWIQDSFHPSALQRGAPEMVDGVWQPGRLKPHNSDPVTAHASCGFVFNKNYHMIRGRLHKCGPCVLLAEFDKQNPLDISDEDRILMNSYKSLGAWDHDQTMHSFFENLDKVIPQCKFCPSGKDAHSAKTIKAVLKKNGSTGSFG